MSASWSRLLGAGVLPRVVVLAAFAAACWTMGCSATLAKTGSIGAILERETSSGWVFAMAIPERSPAERAGLRVGDRIKMVDGNHVDELAVAGVVALLRGPVGTSVTLTVLRGERVLELTVVREPFRAGAKVVPERERVD